MASATRPQAPARWRHLESPVLASGVLLLGLLFGVTCYRAATQSVVHDEALTWQIYLAGPASLIFNHYDANHHFLSTLLERISTGLFGFSELTLRLPALLAAAWYFSIVFRLSRFVFGESRLFLVAVMLLGANPLILDFLVAARGYGLALAFILHALLQLLRYLTAPPDHRNAARRLLYTAAVSLSLSVAANLTLLFPALVLASLFLWIARLGDSRRAAVPAPAVARAKSGKHHRKRGDDTHAASSRFGEMRHFVLPMIAVVLLFFLAAPVANARAGDFYFGIGTLQESLRNLVEVSFAHNPGIKGILRDGRVLRSWLALLAFLMPALALISLVWGARRVWRERLSGVPLDRASTLLFLAAGTMTGSMGLLVATHQLIGFPYPADRTGLYFLALMALCLPALAATLVRGAGALSLAGHACTGFLLLLCVQYGLEWNTSHFRVWRYDADSRKILELVAARPRRAKPPLRIGVSWQLEPSFNFYRTVKHYAWLEPIRRSGPDGEFDYYVLIENDRPLIARRNLQRIYEGPVSGTVLASR